MLKFTSVPERSGSGDKRILKSTPANRTASFSVIKNHLLSVENRTVLANVCVILIAVADSTTGADKASSDSAAHSLLKGNLAGNIVFICNFYYPAEHDIRSAGVDNVGLFRLEYLFQSVCYKAFSARRAVVGTEYRFRARCRKVLLQITAAAFLKPLITVPFAPNFSATASIGEYLSRRPR